MTQEDYNLYKLLVDILGVLLQWIVPFIVGGSVGVYIENKWKIINKIKLHSSKKNKQIIKQDGYNNEQTINKTEIKAKKNVSINNYYVDATSVTTKPKMVKVGDSSNIQFDFPEMDEFSFTVKQRYLISKINKVHDIVRPKYGYDFTEEYKTALLCISEKGRMWQYHAAIHLANCMQDIPFFEAFKNVEEERMDKFISLKGEILAIYNESIQEMRHTDKRGRMKKQFESKFNRKFGIEPKITDEYYEVIFDKFQELLIELFNNFELKKI